MDRRIFGIETEFGCLVRDPAAGTPEQVVDQVKSHVFLRQKLGVIDLHARDYTFEPARAGGFLLNGGRLYVDAVGDHEEYATAECSELFDLASHERAGHRILQQAVREMGLEEAVSFHNNSVDHFGGHTFGCHENYLARLDEDFFRDAVEFLLPFLVTRQIYAGVGRVGGHRLNRTDFRNNIMRIGEHEVDYIWVHNFYGVEIDKTVDFQLSQRADHILKTVASKVRFNRAIINPKWDSYYNFSNLHRLHLLFGEANMSEWATAMKVGTTSLVLDLVEDGLVPTGVRLANPIETLRSVSRDPSWRWPARLASGETIPAVDLQRIYLEAAQRHLAGRDTQTDWVLREWDYALTGLETDPMLLDDRVDWVAKRKLLDMFREAEGVEWHDDVMQSLDLEYHNIDPERGLFHGLVEAGQMVRVLDDVRIDAARETPPANTRAAARGHVIRRLIDARSKKYVIDWDSVYLDRDRYLELRNPFLSYEKEA
ncbi:MAG TPA: proteasome accessory factor PafA2 family protein, partial [Armatimonadota bacterium]|nr:proteasome accessory factor PafA2 family protein [Armatimonadota bacterium]